MKIRNASALLIAAVFAAAVSVGCSSSSDKKSSENAFTAETIRSKGGETQYSTDNFSFSLSSELTKSDMEGFDLVFTAKSFPIMIGISETMSLNMNADANAVEYINTCVEADTPVSWEHFKHDKYDCSVVYTVEYAADENDPNVTQCYHTDTYNAVKEVSLLNIAMSYPDGLQEVSKAYADYILSASEYTGETLLPTEAETVENDYVSVYHEPEWYAAQNEDTDLSDSAFQVINFMYAHTDSFSKAKSKYSLKAVKMRDFNTANKMANNAFDKYSEDLMKKEVSHGTDEIFGEKAFTVTYDTEDVFSYHCTEYYFEKGSIIWCVTTSIPAEDDGTVAADIQKLMDNTTFK